MSFLSEIGEFLIYRANNPYFFPLRLKLCKHSVQDWKASKKSMRNWPNGIWNLETFANSKVFTMYFAVFNNWHLLMFTSNWCLFYISRLNFLTFRANFTTRKFDFWTQEQENLLQGRQRWMEYNVPKSLSTLWTNELSEMGRAL